jgi:hypothetical protein
MSLQFCGQSLGPLLGPRLNDFMGGYGSVLAAIVMLTIAVALVIATGYARQTKP